MQTVNNSQAEGKSWFNQHKIMPFASNRRLGVRFIRDDILVSLRKSNFLTLSFQSGREENFVRLLDISSKGASIATDVKLSVNTKVNLTITFMGSKSFEMPSKVVRVTKAKRPVYGIKFDEVNNRMAEYLVSAKKLAFK